MPLEPWKGAKALAEELGQVFSVKKGAPSYALITKKIAELKAAIEDTYSISSDTELQEAIDEIGTGAGTIFIASDTYVISTAIDVDGGGSIVIYGHGDNTILQPAAGIKVFNVTNCTSLTISNLKLDLSNYAAATQGILINEASDRPVILDNVTITGGGVYGIGVETQSNNITFRNCRITACQDGLYINGSTGCNISDNTVSSNARYGIYLHDANTNVVASNACSSNTNYGIYVDNCDYCTLTGNTCGSNATGIYATASDNNTYSSNTCNSNTTNGIDLENCDYSTISSNTTNANDSTSASATAGLYIGADCDYNTISANSSNNNNNAGAEDAYGIYISAATCNENTISANSATGNDIDYKDSGTDTTLVYYVNNATDLQDAIDSIAGKHGIVNINAGTTTLTQAIDIDGGGSYIIQGEGDNSIIDINGDWKAFNITSAISVTLKNFKIDATDLTTATKEIIDVTEATNYRVNIEHITIAGDGTNGYGIECNSQNVVITECDISSVKYGVVLATTRCTVSECKFTSCATAGIYVTSNYNIISNNTITTSADGIYLSSANNNTISDNNITACTLDGIYLTASTKNSITGNTCDSNVSNTANPQAGIYLTAVSSNNTVNSNNSTSNTNSGAGSGYGILIYTANCLRNTVNGNTCSSNDVNYLDNGTNSDIVYTVTTAADLQAAISSIAAKSGTIRLGNGTIDLAGTAITISGGGSYIIEGSGDVSIIDIGGDSKAFYITSAISCLLRDFKIEASDLTTASKEIIDVTEAAGNRVTIENITITGDGTNGYGIELNSSDCVVINCTISSVNYGIHILSTNNHRITNNYITTCASTGIYCNNADKNTITDNQCTSNTIQGIYMTLCDNNTISSNTITSNVQNGIYLDQSDSNTISSNTTSENDSNTANPQAGIYIANDSDYNTISSNTSNNNNNAGVGYGYGIYIAAATCGNNSVLSNNCSGNDVNYLDSGTNTDVLYMVSSAADLQDSINSIGAKSGKIQLGNGTIDLAGTAITISGGGSYVIEGGGDVSIIDIGGDAKAFYITSAASLVLKDFKIDATDLATATKEIIDITEAANNPVTIQNVTIVGDGTNGYGIELNSTQCTVKDCRISAVAYGINVLSNSNSITDNYITTCTTRGISCASQYNTISDNIITASADGIYLTSGNNNNINGNSISTCTLDGLYLTGSSNNTITGNTLSANDSNTANPQGAIYLTAISNYNTINGNTMTNNNNAGAGSTYGLYIGNANCLVNYVDNNTSSGNDYSYLDLGTNTKITYIVTSAADLQNALDSIAAKSGTIKLGSGTIDLGGSAININGGGSYIIEGSGDISIIDLGGDITAFEITSAISCILRDFKIDAADLTTATKEIIDITEGTNYTITVDNVTIAGDGTNGYGIEINSSNCLVQNCRISSVNFGIRVLGDNNKISGNSTTSCVRGISLG